MLAGKCLVTREVGTTQVFEPHPVWNGVQDIAQQVGCALKRAQSNTLLGDVFNRAFIKLRFAKSVAHQVGQLAHPDTFTGFESVGFRNEICDVLVTRHQLFKLPPPVGVDVEVAGEIEAA